MTKEKRNRPTTGDSPLKMGSLWIQAYRLNPSKPSSQESRGFNHGSVKRGYTSDPGYLVVSYIDPLQSYYSSGTYDWMKSGSGHTWTHTRYGFSR